MNFTASLRLNSTQFKKGVSDIQRSLKGLQTSFMSLAGALGLGLSFGRLGQSLMDTATKLSTAKNVLQNVSKEFGEYGQNLEWLKRISNEYGQDLITLVNSFAQFRAAAASSKLSLEQMRDIYESLTRAAGAFHLSADRTNDMMMAVTQMLSKGKVAAEELRRQLGNVLPGAFNLMAQAAYNAGIITENTTAALEDAMKSGKVIAEQVLPAFAKELNEVTSNADFNSLQTSMNRLKNSWTTMVEGANFEGFYKGIIDGAQKVVHFFETGFWPKIAGTAVGIFGAIGTGWGKSFIRDVKETNAAAIQEFEKTYKRLRALQNKSMEIMREKLNGSGRDLGLERLETTLNGWKKALIPRHLLNPKQSHLDRSLSEKDILELQKAAQAYNEELLKLDRIQRQVTGRGLYTKKDIANINAANAGLAANTDKLKGTESAFQMVNGQVGLFGTAMSKLGSIAKSVLSALGSAFASIAVGAVIGGITYLISKLIEARSEAKRIKNIADDMKKSVTEISEEEGTRLGKLMSIKKALEAIDKDTTSVATKKSLIDQVNKELGRTDDNLLKVGDDIKNKVIPALDEYIRKVKDAAMQQQIMAQISSATTRIAQLEMENMSSRLDTNYGKTKTSRVNVDGEVIEITRLTTKADKLQKNIDKNNKEIEELNKGINRLFNPEVAEDDFVGPTPPWQANQETARAILGWNTKTNNGGGGGGDDGKNKVTPQSTLQEYQKELQKLDNQYKAGAILAADYKEQVEKLNQKVFEDLSSFGWDNAIKGLATSADKALAEELKKTATAKLLEGLDDPEEIAEFDKAMKEEAERAYENLKNAWDKYLEYVKKKPAIGSVDDSDGYMYSKRRSKRQTYSEYDTHFIGEELDVWEKYVDDLNNYKQDLEDALKVMTDADSVAQLNKLLDQTIEKLRLAGFVVKDLKTKANIAELERDIEDLRKEGIDGIFNSITALADGTDRLYRAVQSLQQINDSTWKNEDLENFLTGINAIIQAFEVMKTIIEAVQTTSEIFAKIKEKNSAKAIALNTAEIASENAKASAAAGAAAAGAASSTAGVPIVGPALAVAAVASVVAAIMAGMRKFATGGIVGGNSYSGDHQIARVNSGEVILNRAQQQNLLDIANGKKSSTGGEVQFKIKGSDLVGTLKNYNRLHT